MGRPTGTESTHAHRRRCLYRRSVRVARRALRSARVEDDEESSHELNRSFSVSLIMHCFAPILDPLPPRARESVNAQLLNITVHDSTTFDHEQMSIIEFNDEA